MDRYLVTYKSSSDMEYEIFTTVDKLESWSPTIVEVTATPQSEPYLIQQGAIKNPITKTTVTVTRVYKDESQRISTGSTIQILEPFFTEDKGLMPGKVIYHADVYTNLVPGAKYLMYLAWNEQHKGYWPVALHQGKFNLDGKDSREAVIPSENYKALTQSVRLKNSTIFQQPN